MKNPAAFGIWGLKNWGPDPVQGKAEGGKQAVFFLSFSGDKSQAFWRFQLAAFGATQESPRRGISRSDRLNL